MERVTGCVMNKSQQQDKKWARSQGDGAEASNATAPSRAGPPRWKWRLPLLWLALLVGAGVVSFVVFKYFAPRIPRQLVGTWEVVDGPLQGARLEFRWIGTAIATQPGVKGAIDSTVKVKGDKLFLTAKDPVRGLPETVVQTIVSLGAEELVIRDADQHTYRMKRVHD